ncbi:cupin-like domain-containing protein [Burkholderia pseudomallei]|uniref:cupin-like domain-containing protein n=1 Tax=Burkholderia pseudomallei TaxID=28450 RepID=UPI000538F449|nr:cupin-like domain-containing protein [Burkholderia pseudomallei]KGV56608.1 jmjC domain, hydroxylase family protein [Burkholderia pseudomallei BDU 2]
MPYDEILPIETLVRPKVSDFREHYLEKERPVKIARALNAWPAMQKWSLDYFENRFGDETIGVESFQPDERGPGNNSPQGYVKHLRFQELKLKELIRILRTKPDHMYYMASHPFRKSFPNLRADLAPHPYVQGHIEHIPGAHMDSYLWIGPAGTHTPIHTDPMPNFLTQIVGRKMVYLFPPDQASKNLYIGQFERETFSPVDLEKPDLERYPNYRHCTPYRAIIEPGETLHIPRNWGHCVISMDISISISTFFITYPQLFRLVPEFFTQYVKRAFEGWRWKGMENERAGLNPPPR